MVIRIIIVFIIICLFPIMSYAASDSVWVSKNAGFIKSNESIYFEDYFITSKIINNTTATIIVQKDDELIDTRDFIVNDFRTYGSIQVSLLGIKEDTSWISINKLENKDVWFSLSRRILKWGEKYSIDNYTIDINTIGIDSANLTIYDKNIAIMDTFRKDKLKKYGNLGISLRTINRTGFVELEFFSNESGSIKTEILIDKDEYFPDESINITLKTSNDLEQNIVGIFLDSYPHAEILRNKFSIGGSKGTKFLRSQMNQLPPNSTVTITAKVEQYDYYYNSYMTYVNKDVRIAPIVSIIKKIPSDIDNETVPVQLLVYNSGTSLKSVAIHDSIPKELGAKEMGWEIEVGPRNFTIINYSIIPPKPGHYLLPEATIKWDDQSSRSKKGEMTMHMPYIVMTKTMKNINGQTEVFLLINNTGDRPAQVKVVDNIPRVSSLVSGVTEWEGQLEGGESTSIAYSLNGNINTFPEAEATYRDVTGVIRNARSNTIEPVIIKSREDINENSNTSDTRAHEVLSFMVISFTTIGGIILSVTLIAYLLIRMKER